MNRRVAVGSTGVLAHAGAAVVGVPVGIAASGSAVLVAIAAGVGVAVSPGGSVAVGVAVGVVVGMGVAIGARVAVGAGVWVGNTGDGGSAPVAGVTDGAIPSIGGALGRSGRPIGRLLSQAL